MEESPYYATFDPGISGNTKKSLKMLRDALSNSMTRRIAVIEVPTGEVTFGYLILDKDSRKATWTGDNFRKESDAESELGYKSAKTLISLFGIKPIHWKTVNMDELYFFPERKAREILLGLIQEIAKEIPDSDFFIPIDRDPEYFN